MADWAQTGYRCQIGPGVRFRLDPIPVVRELTRRRPVCEFIIDRRKPTQERLAILEP